MYRRVPRDTSKRAGVLAKRQLRRASWWMVVLVSVCIVAGLGASGLIRSGALAGTGWTWVASIVRFASILAPIVAMGVLFRVSRRAWLRGVSRLGWCCACGKRLEGEVEADGCVACPCGAAWRSERASSADP